MRKWTSHSCQGYESEESGEVEFVRRSTRKRNHKDPIIDDTETSESADDEEDDDEDDDDNESNNNNRRRSVIGVIVIVSALWSNNAQKQWFRLLETIIWLDQLLVVLKQGVKYSYFSYFFLFSGNIPIFGWFKE